MAMCQECSAEFSLREPFTSGLARRTDFSLSSSARKANCWAIALPVWDMPRRLLRQFCRGNLHDEFVRDADGTARGRLADRDAEAFVLALEGEAAAGNALPAEGRRDCS